MNEFELGKLIGMLSAAYPHWNPTPETLDLYKSLLMPLDSDLAKRAAIEFVRSEREFAPPVGALITQVAQLALGTQVEAEEAWGTVMAAVRFQGYYRDPTFHDQATQRTVQSLGWKEICANDNIEATRAHFFRIFNAVQHRCVKEKVHQLYGEDGLKGLDFTTPLLEEKK